MSEFYFQAPTCEEVSVVYKGLTCQEFQVLNDEAVEILRQQEHEEWFAACHESNFDEDVEDPIFWEAYHKAELFNSFVRWRKHGIPDRGMTNAEFTERVRHQIETHRQIDPTYGTLTKVDMAQFTEGEREFVLLAIDEAEASGYEQPIISTHQALMDRLDLSYGDLVQKGILETYETLPDIVFNRGSVGYVLAGKFAAHALVLRYQSSDRNL